MIGIDLVQSTTAPAFCVDADARILEWNDGAERLFGYKRAQIRGKRCWDVLNGIDVFGNDYCTENCPLIGMAARHAAINRCELSFSTQIGSQLKVAVSSLSFLGNSASELNILHLISPIKVDHADSSVVPLTKREHEVLISLGRGMRTSEIGKMLNVSAATVRNHIQSIFRKLDVHSRLAAVCAAWRLGLIDGSNDHEKQ
jgi:DNA-binding CsgD family transcriptional regulator